MHTASCPFLCQEHLQTFQQTPEPPWVTRQRKESKWHPTKKYASTSHWIYNLVVTRSKKQKCGIIYWLMTHVAWAEILGKNNVSQLQHALNSVKLMKKLSQHSYHIPAAQACLNWSVRWETHLHGIDKWAKSPCSLFTVKHKCHTELQPDVCFSEREAFAT